MCDRLNVAVYAIARDEAAHVERFVAAAGDADLVCVADTGSRDVRFPLRTEEQMHKNNAFWNQATR